MLSRLLCARGKQILRRAVLTVPHHQLSELENSPHFLCALRQLDSSMAQHQGRDDTHFAAT